MPLSRCLHALFALLTLSFAGLFAVAAHAGAQSLLSDHQGFYPRVVMISHDATPSRNGVLIASVTGFEGGGHEDIFASHDNGATFTLAGTVQDSDFSKGLCCGGLYELPVAIGAMPAGTLLWAGSVGGDTPAEPMQLKIFKSTDQGATWSYLSNCATGAKPRSSGGLWEADFAIAGNGHLVCYYSDETQDGHSQVLRYVQTTDGITWSTPVDVVSSATQADRPGMINVVQLPNGHFVASFEMCGPLNCAAFLKSSTDGLDWGDVTSHGTAIATADGTTFWHTPTLVWAPVAGSVTGQLVMQGQILVKNGVLQAGNGKTLLINSAGDGSGTWEAFDAPTTIAMPGDTAGNYCQNYSSPLLALDNGQNVIGLASDFVTGTTCKTYVNVTPLGGVKGAAAGTITVTKGSSASGDISLRSSANQAGSYNLSVAAPGVPADVTLSATTVTLSATSDTTVQVTVKPTTLALAKPKGSGVQYAGGFAFGLIGLLGLFRRHRRVAAVLALLGLPMLLLGCGGGSGGGSSVTPPPSTVSTTYSGTLTATRVADPTVTTSVPITITITKTA